jgi:hypothetical protein
MQAATDQMKRIYHYLDKPRSFSEACPQSVEGMTGHILLIGYSCYAFRIYHHAINIGLILIAKISSLGMHPQTRSL